IRDGHVTGVQTCALPISSSPGRWYRRRHHLYHPRHSDLHAGLRADRRYKWWRRLYHRPGELASLLRLLSLQDRLPVQRHGLRVGDGVGALCDQRRARGGHHALVQGLGSLREWLMTVAREVAEPPALTVARRPAPAPRPEFRIPRTLMVRLGLIIASLLFMLPFYWMANSALKDIH